MLLSCGHVFLQARTIYFSLPLSLLLTYFHALDMINFICHLKCFPHASALIVFTYLMIVYTESCVYQLGYG